LDTPGLVIPAGKTSVEFFLECHNKTQTRMMDYV
jgi:hypothetical protein